MSTYDRGGVSPCVLHGVFLHMLCYAKESGKKLTQDGTYHEGVLAGVKFEYAASAASNSWAADARFCVFRAFAA